MRGKRRVAPCERGRPGITPACAGKTRNSHSSTFRSQDHPRVCGENPARLLAASLASGSPPRVRGKLIAEITGDWQRRITPACAGKTSHALSGDCRLEDHPRVCGENARPPARRSHRRGSPPRVRGKHDKVRGGAGDVGITPACAGKTHKAAVQRVRIEDHPRVCGENLQGGILVDSPEGSPPRVRGKPVFSNFCCQCPGITPACAGKTLPPVQSCR